jgi:hypothetical protein
VQFLNNFSRRRLKGQSMTSQISGVDSTGGQSRGKQMWSSLLASRYGHVCIFLVGWLAAQQLIRGVLLIHAWPGLNHRPVNLLGTLACGLVCDLAPGVQPDPPPPKANELVRTANLNSGPPQATLSPSLCNGD